MSSTGNLKKLGAAGGIAAALAAFAHGVDDCARAGVPVSTGAADDVARIAPAAAGDDVAAIAPVVQRRSALAAAEDAVSAPSPGAMFGEELQTHMLDAVDLLLDVSSDVDQDPSSTAAKGSFLSFDARSSRADFRRQLGAARVGPPVFVLGHAPRSNSDAIAMAAGDMLGVGEIQGECLSHGLSCIVLICGPETAAATQCVTRAHAAAVASVVNGSGSFEQMLRELLHERAAQRLDTLTVYRLANTPEGPGIIRSLSKQRSEKDAR